MTESPRLLDAYGRPVNLTALHREHAAPQIAGVRQVWAETVASGLTPRRLLLKGVTHIQRPEVGLDPASPS